MSDLVHHRLLHNSPDQREWRAWADQTGVTGLSFEKGQTFEIDDAALNTYKDDPLVFWTPQIAKAVEVLRQAGAVIVGLDLMFSISPEQWLRRNQAGASSGASTYDLPIRREIASGQLILVASSNKTSRTSPLRTAP